MCLGNLKAVSPNELSVFATQCYGYPTADLPSTRSGLRASAELACSGLDSWRHHFLAKR